MRVAVAQGPLLAVDPGLHHCGVSLWRPDGRLWWARLVVNPVEMAGTLNAQPMAQAVVQALPAPAELAGLAVVVEVPQVYGWQRGRGRGVDPNDLIDLAAVVGGVLALVPAARAVVYRPAEWKGQTPKEVTTARAKATLSSAERAVVMQCSPASLMHNVWDAVALGLAHLKRAGRR